MTSLGFGANRRGFLTFGGALALGSLSTAAFAQQEPESPAAKVPLDLLMAEQALPDIWLGDAKAPVTIIEYASMTCPHCADFNTKTLPLLKSNYIDKGKVRFTLREFPLDPLAAAAFMLARCSGDKREAMVELLFSQLRSWAYTDKPVDALLTLVKQTGMGQTAFEACLNDEGLFKKIDAVRSQASQKFGITSTPTFFINGEKHSGEILPDALDATLAPFFK